jgi:hypothetical protein
VYGRKHVVAGERAPESEEVLARVRFCVKLQKLPVVTLQMLEFV